MERRCIDTEEFRFEYKPVNSKYILSEPSYQRMVDFARVKKIVAHFNQNLVNPIKVSYRDGKYWVFDGQHTLKALMLRNGNKDLMVECKVHYGMTMKDEARLFAEQNGISKAVSKSQKLKSLYIAGDVDVVQFKEAVESVGFICDFSTNGNRDARYKIVCYSTLFDIFMKRGESHMQDLLRILLEAWSGETDSMRKEIVSGLNIFMVIYKGEYDRDMLVSKLSKTHPGIIVRDGKAMLSGGSKRFARVILGIYNKHLTRNKLIDKIG